MKKALFEMQQDNTRLRAQLESVLANIADSNRSRRIKSEPCLDNLYPDRSVQYPVAEGTKNKCQCFWSPLRELTEDVHDSPMDNATVTAACSYITIFRLHSLICEVKYKHRIENGKPFKDTDPQAKLAAIEALEDMTVPFIPLRACVGS